MIDSEKLARLNYHRRMADLEQACGTANSLEQAGEHISAVFYLEMGYLKAYAKLAVNPTSDDCVYE
jgi:hypothetical protein